MDCQGHSLGPLDHPWFIWGVRRQRSKAGRSFHKRYDPEESVEDDEEENEDNSSPYGQPGCFLRFILIVHERPQHLLPVYCVNRNPSFCPWTWVPTRWRENLQTSSSVLSIPSGPQEKSSYSPRVGEPDNLYTYLVFHGSMNCLLSRARYGPFQLIGDFPWSGGSMSKSRPRSLPGK